jgi:hypothetical protein
MHYVCQRSHALSDYRLERWQIDDSCVRDRGPACTLPLVPTNNEKLRTLRLKYNAAHAAHQALACKSQSGNGRPAAIGRFAGQREEIGARPRGSERELAYGGVGGREAVELVEPTSSNQRPIFGFTNTPLA